MPSRKQADDTMDGGSSSSSALLLQRIRNMWEFANLCQWIYIFGKAVKIDESLEIDDMETECLKPSSTVLADIGLALLKLLSSHRGLTHEIFDEQLRKQYTSRLPAENPLGNGETATYSFSDLDSPSKICVLQKLTEWIMVHPERLREKMEELKDGDQLGWRVEPIGWDADDRTYYVLDDNRVYRVSEAPEAPVRKARKQKTYGSSRRSSKRRQTREIEIAEDVALTETPGLDQESAKKSSMGGGMLWECVAVTLDDVRVLVEGFRKTRDANEKVLREQLCTHLLPILERQDESRKRKEVQRERELLSLAKMANAKRSSRIAGKAEQQREEEKAREERETLRKEQEAQRREEQKRAKLERERDFRMFSREKRLKERGARRQLHEEELAQLSEGRHSTPDGPTRISDRQLQSEIDRNKQALKELEEEEEEWIFDCVCGLYGQVDDGAHSIACERCNVWQHSKCVGIKESEADRADFHFLCGSCKRRLESDTPRKTVIKLKVKGSNDLIPLQPDLNRDSVLSSIKPENSEAVAAANEENETRSAKAALGNGLATPEIRINSSQSNLSLNSGVSQPRNASLTSASNTTNALGKVGSAEESSLMDSELSHSTNSAQIPIQQAGVPGAVEPEGVKLGPVGRKSMHPAQPSATASPIEAHQPGSMDGAQKMPLAQGPPRLHDRSNLDSSATGYSIGHAELQTTPTASQTVSTARALDVVDQQGVKNAVTPAQGNIITLNESGKALATTETPNSMQESTSGRALAPHQNGSNDH